MIATGAPTIVLFAVLDSVSALPFSEFVCRARVTYFAGGGFGADARVSAGDVVDLSAAIVVLFVTDLVFGGDLPDAWAPEADLRAGLDAVFAESDVSGFWGTGVAGFLFAWSAYPRAAKAAVAVDLDPGAFAIFGGGAGSLLILGTALQRD